MAYRKDKDLNRSRSGSTHTHLPGHTIDAASKDVVGAFVDAGVGGGGGSGDRALARSQDLPRQRRRQGSRNVAGLAVHCRAPSPMAHERVHGAGGVCDGVQLDEQRGLQAGRGRRDNVGRSVSMLGIATSGTTASMTVHCTQNTTVLSHVRTRTLGDVSNTWSAAVWNAVQLSWAASKAL